MRLFVSVDFKQEICDRLVSRAPAIPGWKHTPADHLHLTLFFLGECTPEERERISERLQRLPFQPFEVTFDRLGVFPSRNGPKVLWCGVQTSRRLKELHRRIVEQLSELAKATPAKSYIPHVTLARRKRGRGKDPRIIRLLDQPFEPLRTIVESYTLKKSLLHPDGAEHIVLKNFPG